MTEIRRLEERDLGAVCGLIGSLLPEWGGDRAFLRATALDYPWADPEVGSLVSVDQRDEVVGFIGAQVRRLRYRDRQIRGVCCSHLVVSADHRAGAAGATLLRRLLSGPQELTWSDTANEIVARMWRAFGGQRDNARACDWMLVLRPAGWVGNWAEAGLRRRPIGRETIPVAALPFQPFAKRRRPPARGIESVDASAAEVIAELPALRREFVASVDYDREHLEQLFGQLRARGHEVVCRLVRRGERAIGWYVYLPVRSRASRVLSLWAAERDADDVLDDLIAHARVGGSAVLVGRLEPHLGVALQRRLAVLGIARNPVIHAHDPELRASLAGGLALLTQLDGEWFVT